MENLFYISVLSASSAGTLEFSLESFNAETNVTLTLSATGILSTDTPISIAKKINDQFIVQLEAYAYTGINTFADQDPRAYFSVNRTDHMVSVSSQCNFSLTLTDNDTGAIINVAQAPSWVTVADARSIATILGEDFEDGEGNDFTDQQLALIIEMGSAEIGNIINNFICMALYIDHRITEGSRSIFLPKKPVRNFYAPCIRRPMIYATTIQGSNLIPKSNYAFNPKYAELTYRFAQDLVDNPEPFDLNNEVITGYLAGYYQVPTAIKQALVEFITQVTIDSGTGGFTEIAGGSARFKFQTRSEILTDIISKLRAYFL